MTDIVLFGSADRMRRQAASISVLALIRESCFLSPERPRHGACRAAALDLLDLHDEPPQPDEAIEETIQADPAFPMHFYCRGAAAVCARCGALVPPGATHCLEEGCDQGLEQPVGLLARPEWETRLATKALEVAITTTLVADNLLMYTINRTVRLFVLRNYANQAQGEDWKRRVREMRNLVLDAWPEDLRPGQETWEYRFVRQCAVFWVVAWPMLRQAFTLEEIDGWNTRLVRAAASSSQRWADACADPGTYARLVRQIMDAEGLDHEKAIQALRPSDLGEGDENGPDRGVVVLHLPELVTRSAIAYTPLGDPFMITPLELEEAEAILARYHSPVEEAAIVAARFSRDGT